MNRSASGFPVYHQLPEFTQTHVHRVGDAIRHLILCCSHIQFFIAPWTVVCQALLSMGFSRLEYWSGLSFPSSRELSDPRMEPASSASQAGSLPIELPGKPSNALGRLTVQVGLNCGLWCHLQVDSVRTELNCRTLLGFPDGSGVKASACNVEDLGSIPGLGRSPVEGNGNPLQYSCLENPMDGGAWWTIVHGVPESDND